MHNTLRIVSNGRQEQPGRVAGSLKNAPSLPPIGRSSLTVTLDKGSMPDSFLGQMRKPQVYKERMRHA